MCAYVQEIKIEKRQNEGEEKAEKERMNIRDTREKRVDPKAGKVT